MLVFKYVIPISLLFSSIIGYAQSLWTSVEAKYEFVKKFSASLEGEYRTGNKFSSTDRWTIGLGVNYKVIPYLKLDGGYKFIDKYIGERITSKGNIVDAYWQPRHRAWFSIAGEYKWHRFSFSLRERYQFTHNKSMFVKKTDAQGNPKTDEYIQGKDRNVLRSRVKVDYSFNKIGFKPYLSAEVYNKLKKFRYNKTRLTVGTEYKFNNHNRVEVFYRYIDQSDQDEEKGNVIGVGYQFKF